MIQANRYCTKEGFVRPRYSDRKPTTCKVTLSCGARVGEGQILDLTVPGCRLETAVLLEAGQSVHCAFTWISNAPCGLIWGWCDGQIEGRRALSSCGCPRTIPSDSVSLWGTSTNAAVWRRAGASRRSVWATKRTALLPVTDLSDSSAP